ncbi:MAG: hypothetical protein M1839_003649 [Geoglossum umbratile]|nr:MAG: hypothetical protein M1839_003649 [Geoglossum umbratile]
MNKHMTENGCESGLGNPPLPKSQLKFLSSSARMSSIMSGSEGSAGIAILSIAIPDSIIADAASKINQHEVQAALSTDPTVRVYLAESRSALELIYNSFQQVDKAILARLMGASVAAVEAHIPRKVMFVHSDNHGHNFWTFDKDSDALIVLIPVVQPKETQVYQYIKDSHKKDFELPPTSEVVTKALKPGQIMIHHSRLIFRCTLKKGEVCAMFIYKLSADS